MYYMSTISKSLVEAACEVQYNNALWRHNEGNYAFRESLGIGYDGDEGVPEWAKSLGTIIEQADQPLAVLDIGAGDGSFLKGLLTQTSRIRRAIGFTAAVELRGKVAKDIEWVTGDFQRPNTWSPRFALESESIDIITSGRTFTFFVDPLRALENALSLLKPDGHVFIDHIDFHIERSQPRTASTIVNVLRKLNQRGDEFNPEFGYFDQQTARLHELGVHLRKGSKNPTFPSITKTRLIEIDQNHVVYGSKKRSAILNTKRVLSKIF
jgi:SAM-dependent methyltransferase